MAKHGFLTAKAIGNRIKAKGLQKLRWYCTMCQKQCRDENGFKCHIESESHLRQMTIVAANPSKIIDEFSKEFEESFLDLLSRRYGEKRAHANVVYTEFIADKNHMHMNSTMWQTLTGFVKYLGRTKKCIVDETEKGWYIQWIRKDPEALARNAALAEMERAKVDEVTRERRNIEKIIKEAKAKAEEMGVELEPQASEIEEGATISSIVMKAPIELHAPKTVSSSSTFSFDKATEVKIENDEQFVGQKRKATSSIAVIMESEKRQKMEADNRAIAKAAKEEEELLAVLDKKNRKEYWLQKGIVVKIVNKKLKDGAFYKEKAVVADVIDDFTGELHVISNGKKLRMDQEDLETVIPKVGGLVVILQGAFRGESAVLKMLDEDKFCVSVEIADGYYKGRKVDNLPYEEVCKKN